jgi:lipid II:glycine glycyltransferase (peptidoglycan interpeptide bridge formation enzyme)
VIEFLQSEKPVEGSMQSSFHTLVLQLRPEPESLLAAMKKDTRYEIRRAQAKDDLHFEFHKEIPDEIFSEFIRFHEKFSANQGRANLNERTLRRYVDEGHLNLSCMKSCNGKSLTWHSYVVVKDRARLLHSASHLAAEAPTAERSLIGRANRLHHWLDILRFRDVGLQIYDLGGWYAGKDDPKKIKINQFKEEFGGTLESSYNCLVPVSIAGKLYTQLKRLRG